MIIGMRQDQFIAAQERVHFPDGSTITAANLPAGWREVEAPVESDTPAPVARAHTPGQWAEVDDVVAYGGLTYRVRQRHLMQADWLPDAVLALFLRVNDTDDWVPGEQVEVGTRRLYEGLWYLALQAHVTQSDWTPPAVSALWELEPGQSTGEDWIDTGATVAQLVAAGVYRVSLPLGGQLTPGQAIRLGTAETTFAGFWGGTQDYLLITPHVSAAIGAPVARWA